VSAQYWQTVGQWEEYFNEKEKQNERTQETDAGTSAATEHEARENGPQ
jgi:hypothetical protein